MKRRRFLTGAVAIAIARPTGPRAAAAPAAVGAIAAVEAHAGGRLGVFAVDTGTGSSLGHRESQRFPMCSTFKLVLVGAILARVDRGEERLDRRIAYTSRDLLDNSPVTAAHQAGGALSIAALCAAAIERSDNAAANLLLRAVDGPPGVTRFARSIGDPSTRLDRSEPDLNSAVPGDARDTTTPRAMAHTMFRLAGGGALAPPSRALLRGWLESTQTGLDRLRAGFPATWRSGDKTGSGAHATSNDVAFTHPPGRAPIIVAAYLTESRLAADDRAAALAHVGRIVAAAFASTQAKPAKHA